MTEQDHLLTILAEEGAEVSHRTCKALRFGMGDVEPGGQTENNRRRLERELADLVATAELLGLVIREEDKAAKREKIARFMAYSRKVGRL